MQVLHVVDIRQGTQGIDVILGQLFINFEQHHRSPVLLVAAEMQNIVYGEYLPTVLGVDFMTRYGLIVEEETTYDPNL